MHQLLSFLDTIFRQLALSFLRIYQHTLSPDRSPFLRGRLGGTICAHEPHCSDYARQCFQRYSFFRAVSLSLERVSQCQPAQTITYDPVSYRIVFFSSAPIGIPFLEAINANRRFDLVGVVTMPDAPVGRGMKVQENIIKQQVKTLMDNGQWKVEKRRDISKVILLHGKDATPEDKWYPWFITEMKRKNIPIFAPYLPKKDDPVLEEWLQEIDRLAPDEHTIVVGHSRGGVAILRRLESRKKPLGKIILVATNDSIYEESKNGFFTDKEYDYGTIKKHCLHFIVFHSTDDQRVPFAHGEKIASGLGAQTRFPTGYNHFGIKESPTLPELLDHIPLDRTEGVKGFVQTPNSLRLDSKKYGDEAQQFKQWIEAKKPDMCVVIAYGKLLPKRLLDLPHFGTINVHGSLLPAYRGASPLQSVFLNGEKETGITIMLMDEGLDTGPMLKKITTPLPLDRTVKELITRIINQGPHFLLQTMREWGKGRLQAVAQDEPNATVCGKFTKEDGTIDPFSDDLLEVYQKRQAFALRPKLFFIREKKGISIEGITLKPGLTREDLRGKQLLMNVKDQLQLADPIQELLLKPEGKKVLSFESFVHGYAKK